MSFMGETAAERSVHRPAEAVGGSFAVRDTANTPTLRGMGRAAGFTLIELLVTLAVAATLITIAVPSYRQLIASNRLSALANEYVLAVNEARMEAIRRNTTVQVCASSGNGTGDLATACGTTNTGAIYALPSDPDDDPVEIRTAPTVKGLQLLNFHALSYNAQGLGHTPGDTTPFTGRIADLYSDQLSSGSHRCIYMTTGSNLKTCANDTTCDDDTEPAACN